MKSKAKAWSWVMAGQEFECMADALIALRTDKGLRGKPNGSSVDIRQADSKGRLIFVCRYVKANGRIVQV